ncbi:MAG: hypothetical protein J6Z02_06310 [Lachnospiraceae bacterium]|nr:hypothetical protein [Lachnospiraceae bacterium]
MKSFNTLKLKKIASGVMATMMLLSVLFLASFIAFEAGHDCIGEECHVCESIKQCETVLMHIGGGKAVQTATYIPLIAVIFSASLIACSYLQETLVSRKVRLND